MNTDGTVLMVTASNQAVRVAHYAADGSELRAVQLDGERYSRAQTVSDGVILFGAENDQPVAAFIDLEFNVTEVELTLPQNTTFASTIGLSRRGNESFYTGTALDAAGESRVIFWDMTGTPSEQIDATNIWARKTSGESMLVDTEQGTALIVRDEALAALLGIEVDTPAVASQIPAFGNRGLTDVSITEVVQRGDEIFLSVISVNESGALVHTMLVGSLEQFPSPWQNFQNRFDVNESQQVSPIDALLIINRLRNPDRVLGAKDLNDLNRLFRYDVNGSGTVTPSDALLVINQLRIIRGSAEGESTVAIREFDAATQGPWIGSDGVFETVGSEEQLRKGRRDLSERKHR
jgi:hypothetical protein